MDINEVNKTLKNLKEARKLAKENATSETAARAIDEKFADLIEYYENVANGVYEDNANQGALTINDLNQKYSRKYLFFNGDEDGSQFVYVDKIHMNGDEIVVDGTMLYVNIQNNSIEIESIENYSFHEFYYFDDYYAPYETCEELDKMLESNPLDTDLPSHVVSRGYIIESVNSDLGFLFGEESGDDIINDMFNDVHVADDK